MDGHVDNHSVRYQHPQLAISALLQEPVSECQLLENDRVVAKPTPSTSSSPTLAPSTCSSVSNIAKVKHATLSKLTQSNVQAEESRNSGAILCMNCKTTTTPLWRRDPNSGSHLCNRCGLYLKTYNVMHPLKKIKRRTIGICAQTKRMSLPSTNNSSGVQDMDDVEQIPRPANCNPPQLQQLPEGVLRRRRVTPKQQINLGITPHCFNCSAENTPLWRRDPEDNIICNACGLYYKLHGKARPVSMRRSAIKRRNRTTASTLVKSTPSTEAGRIVEPMPPVTRGAGGLDFLMHAVELCSPHTKQNYSTTRNSECSMLESLANVATAEFKSQNIRCYSEDRSDKEKLQQECKRLEQLLAQSRAVLDKMN
ncbi:GATA type transcriptional activator of nitrogen-regulated proteins [Coemansia sp. RSA 1365]|nr:GATA type transcriptional activator of nitrogen-regulated proteins [Coemansia sp. RSA 1365]